MSTLLLLALVVVGPARICENTDGGPVRCFLLPSGHRYDLDQTPVLFRPEKPRRQRAKN
jgi:hypothetical protein